jgi:hypothetical protein
MTAERDYLPNDTQYAGLPETRPEVFDKTPQTPQRDLLGNDKGTARSWSDIVGLLPENLKTDYPDQFRSIRSYFRMQLHLAEGRKTKAGRISEGLAHREGFEDFEDANQELFAAIEVAVRGETKRRVEPGFVVSKLRKSGY